MTCQRIVGISPRAMQLDAELTRAARRGSPVLLIGPTGSGKDVLAGALHARMSPSDRRFVAANAAAIHASLAESELFGHERGSFTGAEHSRRGLFAQANDGTLFLDEIGDLPPSLQATLLRILDSGEYRTLGGDSVRRFTGRLICATNKDLWEEVEAGRFRRDLFYRLHVLVIVVPSLNERREDIPLFIAAALAREERPIRVERAALHALQEASWDGNIRELNHVMERLVTATDDDVITLDLVLRELSSRHRRVERTTPRARMRVLASQALDLGVEDAPTMMVNCMHEVALERAGGIKSKAARVLRVDRKVVERHGNTVAKAAPAANDEPEGRP